MYLHYFADFQNSFTGALSLNGKLSGHYSLKIPLNFK